MNRLMVGNTPIDYVVRYSERATTQRIVVTPEAVEVIAPKGTPLEGPHGILSFVHEKRRWLYTSVKELEEKQAKLLVQHYASGAKIQYRGRWLMQDLQAGDVDEVLVEYRSKFHITVPRGLTKDDRGPAVGVALEAWLRERAQADLQAFTQRHAKRLGVTPKGARLSDSVHSWGTCGKDEIIRVHWRLIQAPKVAFEYVVAHEVAHLLHRNHSPELWQTLAKTMPEWAQAKALLERWEGEHRAV